MLNDAWLSEYISTWFSRVEADKAHLLQLLFSCKEGINLSHLHLPFNSRECSMEKTLSVSHILLFILQAYKQLK